MAAIAEKPDRVRIKLTQGIAGHRTRTIPASTERVVDRETDEARTVKVAARVEIIGEFAYSPGDEVDWDRAEAAKFVEKGYATLVEAKNN